MFIFDILIPPLYLLSSYCIFYLIFQKKYEINNSLILGYLFGSISIILFNKFFLYFNIIYFYKYFIFIILIIYLSIIILKRSVIKNNFKNLKYLVSKNKNNYLFLFLIFVFLYALLQSIMMPPVNLDSFVYNITRNYLFIQENNLYPFWNIWSQNLLIMPLNSDLQFLTYAVFNSDFFMNVPNFFGFIILGLVFYKLLIILKVELKKVPLILLIFLSCSNIFLSQFNTKNDIQVTIYFLISLYFLFQILQNKKEYVIFLILSVCFLSGIKWTSIFLITPIIFLSIITFYKKNLIMFSLKNLLYFMPLIIFILPIDIAYLNLKFTGSLTGSANTEVGNIFLHEDGLKGMLSNIVRYLILSFDISFPVHRIGLSNITDIFDSINKTFQFFLFSSNTLGISNFIKDSVFFDYKYLLRPHSDFVFYGIFGLVFFLSPIISIFNIKNIYQSYLIFTSLFFILFFSLTISWFPWNARYLSAYYVMGCLLFAIFNNKFLLKYNKFIKVYVITLICFNLFGHVPQPLVKHSDTDSWLKTFSDRENFKKFTIPEINKVKKIEKYIKNGENILIVMNNDEKLIRLIGPYQSIYQMFRTYNNSYIKLVDQNLKSIDFHKILGQKLQITKDQNFQYIISFNNEEIKNNKISLINKNYIINDEYPIHRININQN